MKFDWGAGAGAEPCDELATCHPAFCDDSSDRLQQTLAALSAGGGWDGWMGWRIYSWVCREFVFISKSTNSLLYSRKIIIFIIFILILLQFEGIPPSVITGGALQWPCTEKLKPQQLSRELSSLCWLLGVSAMLLELPATCAGWDQRSLCPGSPVGTLAGKCWTLLSLRPHLPDIWLQLHKHNGI